MLIAVGILGFIGPAFVLAINTAYRANQIVDEKIQAEALARSQLDSIMAMDYNSVSSCYTTQTCYPVTGTLPGQYNVVITTTDITDPPTCSAAPPSCNTLQLVTASVSRPTGDGGSRLVLAVSVWKGEQ